MASSSYVLHCSSSGNYNAFAPLIVAEYCGISQISIKIDKYEETERISTNPSPLNGPIALAKDGRILCCTTNAVSKFIARLRYDTTKILGNGTLRQNLEIEDWLMWASNDVALPVTVAYYIVTEILPSDTEALENAKSDIEKALGVLEHHLGAVENGHNMYLLESENITLLDIILVSYLYYPFTMIFDEKILKKYTNTTQWFLSCTQQKEFVAVLGNVDKNTMRIASSGNGKKSKDFISVRKV